MAYQIVITGEAESQLRKLPVREQRIVESAVMNRLCDQPAVLSKAIKRLRPNSLAEYELRVGDLRVLYNVEEDSNEVALLVVGRKDGNKLIVGGEEFDAHQIDPPEPPGIGPPGDAE